MSDQEYKVSGLVVLFEGEPRVNSRDLSKELDIEHESLIRIIEKNFNDFNDFGLLRFEIGKVPTGGRPEQFVRLNEDQCYFALTLVRNSKKSVPLKKQLVQEFGRLRRGEDVVKQQLSVTRIPYPTFWNEILGFNQITQEGDTQCKATRRTYDSFIKRDLGFRDPHYIQELTNVVMITFTGFTVADFRRGWGIRPGSRVRTRLFYNDHLRNATDQVEREVVDCARARRITDFEEIKKIAYDTAESLRLQYNTHALPLGECVPEELHLRLVANG